MNLITVPEFLIIPDWARFLIFMVALAFFVKLYLNIKKQGVKEK